VAKQKALRNAFPVLFADNLQPNERCDLKIRPLARQPLRSQADPMADSSAQATAAAIGDVSV
jgi:hypothetical protein